MKMSIDDVWHSYSYASAGVQGENRAYINTETGDTHWHSEFGDNFEELPEDIDDEKYVALPHKNDLDLGVQLVFNFVDQYMPEDYATISDIFRKKGAYSRFSSYLENRNKLQQWYDYRDKAEDKALREWCKENGIQLKD